MRRAYVPELVARALAAALLLAAGGCGGPGRPARPVPTCPAAGPFVIHGDEDVAAVAGCARLPGLAIRTGAPISLAPLTGLVAIDGDLTIGPTVGVTTLSFPAVAAISGKLRIAGNGDLTGVFLPALRRVATVEIADDVSLTTVSLPALTTIDGPLVLLRVPALELVDTSALVEVAGPITVDRAPALTSWPGRPPP